MDFDAPKYDNNRFRPMPHFVQKPASILSMVAVWWLFTNRFSSPSKGLRGCKWVGLKMANPKIQRFIINFLVNIAIWGYTHFQTTPN